MKSREKILMQKIAKREKMKKKLSEKPAANGFVEEGEGIIFVLASTRFQFHLSYCCNVILLYI